MKNRSDALQLVLERNAFYRNNYRRFVAILFIQSTLLLVVSIVLYYTVVIKPSTTYFASTPDGVLIRLEPLAQPLKSNEFVSQWAAKSDSRITKIGYILRKLRIDELPQLLLVLSGSMSLIGPRPERPKIDDMLRNYLPNYDLRYSIKPGISGWAQVNYPYGASIEDAKLKLSYDLYYIKNFSILLDLIIFFKTIKLILNGKGAIPLQERA